MEAVFGQKLLDTMPGKIEFLAKKSIAILKENPVVEYRNDSIGKNQVDKFTGIRVLARAAHLKMLLCCYAFDVMQFIPLTFMPLTLLHYQALHPGTPACRDYAPLCSAGYCLLSVNSGDALRFFKIMRDNFDEFQRVYPER